MSKHFCNSYKRLRFSICELEFKTFCSCKTMKRLLIVCITFSTIFGKFFIIIKINLVIIIIFIVYIGLKIFGNENQKWGHIKVREHANLFYWLYYTTAEVNRVSEKPLIIWLQGGPGASSTGFGNFAEIGTIKQINCKLILLRLFY